MPLSRRKLAELLERHSCTGCASTLSGPPSFDLLTHCHTISTMNGRDHSLRTWWFRRFPTFLSSELRHTWLQNLRKKGSKF